MPEERKLVSVLFADIVGSTALGEDNDPEVVRGVLSTYFERVRDIVEAHGGTVEKFIGDAAMAVFGVPRLHDDDAERAVRAALAIQQAILDLNAQSALTLEARVGVNSGEVVAATDEREQFLVTGDVVNVAARLQQRAEAGEVLVGPLTEQLTKAAIEYEPGQTIDVRGRSEPVTVARALRPRSETPDQARGLPGMRARLVGRTRELRLLIDTFERARDDQRPQLFTVVGNAGVGKSRLIGEFLARISGADDVRVDGIVTGLTGDVVKIEASRAAEPPLTVLRGRCLPYGTGITYWPLMELVQADLGVTLSESRATVLARLEERFSELGTDQRARPSLRARLLVLLGLEEPSVALPDVAAARRTTELAWALGAYLEAIAAGGPLVVVVDDLQWADDSVLEIVRDLLDRVVDVPLLVVCIARPELLERETAWGSGRPNSTTIVLEPLNGDETRTLIARLLDVDDMPEHLRTRIVARSEGNPLFVEEFVRMLIEEGRLVRESDRWRAASADSLDVRVPESIQALIGARLDALTPAEKALVHAASVIGEEFELDQAVRLTGGADIGDALDSIVRRGIVAPNRRTGPGAHRFRHLLIRDVAYATLPKSERARLHDAFGRQLEAEADAAGRRDEIIEIVAYHAERALTLSTELRLSGPTMADRARRALDLALSAGERAVARQDTRSAPTFLATSRAAVAALGDALDPPSRARQTLLEGEVAAIAPDYAAAQQILREAAQLAEAANMHAVAGTAWRELASVVVTAMGSDDEWVTIADAVASARREYQAAGDERGRIAAEIIGLEDLYAHGRLTEMIRESLRLADEAEAIGDLARVAAIKARLIAPALWHGEAILGEELAAAAIHLCDELGLAGTRRVAQFFQARLAWLRGDLDDAEARCRALIQDAEDAGEGGYRLSSYRLLAETLLDQGRFVDAKAVLDRAIAISISTGDRWSRTELHCFRCYAELPLGDLAGFHADLAVAEATLRHEDVAAVGEVHVAQGRLAAAAGRDADAEAAFRAADAVARSTEYMWWAMTSLELAEYLASRGRLAEAAPIAAEVDAAMRGWGYGLRRARIEAVLVAASRTPA
jgi:predicted ATPase/class 3 adenylate cyclase